MLRASAGAFLAFAVSAQAHAAPFFFSTGAPTDQMAARRRAGGAFEIERRTTLS